MSDYLLIDSGGGEKLEQFGPFKLIRPCTTSIWKKQASQQEWETPSASFSRERVNRWTSHKVLPEEWKMSLEGIQLKVSLTEFGHLGVFPEHAFFWKWIREQVSSRKQCSVLNLFAYSGGASLAAAQGGAQVCHLDASKGMIEWARENARLNNLEKAPIRWIVDDVIKFLKREIRRGNHYDAIILDPPTFGRGASGEVFKIERDLLDLLQQCSQLLSAKPLFLLLSCHTPGFTPRILRYLLQQTLPKGRIEEGEMVLEGKSPTLPIPSGVYARWLAS